MEKELQDTQTITSLPYEIITLILQNSSYRDIVNFGSSCKELNEMVKNNQYLWKEKFKRMFPTYVCNSIDKNNDGDWLGEIKTYYRAKKEIHSELLQMSPKYYWQNKTLSIEDVRKFFCIALSSNSSYYYTVYILQDTIKKGYRDINKLTAEKPFTLTEIYYAKIALCYLVNTYLTVKWVQGHVKKELHPEIVVNFFLQWIDPLNMHFDQDIECAINYLVAKVETLLLKDHPSNIATGSNIREKCISGFISERQVLAAITQVLYQQRHVAIMSVGNLDTLDIIKVLKHQCGNEIVVGTVYQAVAKKFGVMCDLIAFPNHFFLNWRSTKDGSNQIYKVDLETGELQPKRNCPFSQNTTIDSYKYCPDSLLHYIISSFLTTMNEYKTWYTQNAIYLLDFLSSNENSQNPYLNFLPYLLDKTREPALTKPIHLTYFHDEHLQIILLLTYLNTDTEARTKTLTVKRHENVVKYAVGMICSHKKYAYVCIIRDWYHTCIAVWENRTEIMNLQFGAKQPFYIVTAADQSERYVAQENLVEIKHPNRLHHLEDIIAKEFTHFNGFSYVPNNEKKMEYPEDAAISELFRNRAQLN